MNMAERSHKFPRWELRLAWSCEDTLPAERGNLTVTFTTPRTPDERRTGNTQVG
jgi:hypothetical protein